MSLILYTTVGISDFDRATRFYDAVFAPLGFGRNPGSAGGWAAYGAPSYEAGVSFHLCPPFDGGKPTAGNGTMIAFGAKSAAEVRAFHTAAIANGGSDEGAPGTRLDYGPKFYVAYVRDPDGNKLSCVFAQYDASSDI